MVPPKAAVRRNSIGGLLGLIIGAVGLAFVTYRVVDGWEEVSASLHQARLDLLLYAVLVGLAGMTAIGLNWVHVLAKQGGTLPYREGLFRYFVGQLGKYVPGGIWPIVGRAEMATRSGIARQVAYTSTLLSLAATYLAAVVSAALFYPFAGSGSPGWASLVLLTIPLGLAVLHPKVIHTALRVVRRLTKRDIDISIPSWSSSVLLVLRHVPAWLAISGATHLCVIGLGGTASLASTGFATCIAWFLGFIVVGLPGGIGVREAVFATLLGGSDPAVTAAVAVVARIVFVAVDVLGASYSTLAIAAQRKREI